MTDDNASDTEVDSKLARAAEIEAEAREARLQAELDRVREFIAGLGNRRIGERVPDVSETQPDPLPGVSAPPTTDEGDDADSETTSGSALATVELRRKMMKVNHQFQLLELRQLVSGWALAFVGLQIVVANVFFGWYLWHNRADPEPVIMGAWLSATVVEVIGILWVIARNLFPYRDKNRNGESASLPKRG